MKKSEQAETSKGEDVVDLISNLPDHILQLILSRLQGTEEVIRTSILSTRWRYLWTSVPSIDIDYARGLVIESDSDGFREFVYWVILNKPQHLDSFRLWCSNFYNMLTIRLWIHAAVMRKVKLLDLMFCLVEESEDIQIPHSLVTCDSLEVLKLCLLLCPLSLPKITGFKALRVLELREVDLFGDNLVKYFLDSCPLLEDLSLIDCPAYQLFVSSPKLKNLRIETRKLVREEEDDDENIFLDWRMCFTLEISCPKLVFLKLTGYVAMTFLFENLYSLKEIVMHPEDLFLEAPSYDLFASISHLESLSISLSCMRGFFDARANAPISLPNLKTLELTIDGINLYALIPLLLCLPDLESLNLIIPKHIYFVHTWSLEDALRMRFWTLRLKKVKFLEFNEEKPKLALARALLEHGKVLEEMVFSWGDEAKFHERSMEAINQVSKFHKASPAVKLRCVINTSQNDPRPALNLIPL